MNFKWPILFWLMAFNAFGFEATLTIQPPVIRLGEAATLSIEVRNARNPDPPALPNVPGLRFANAGQSTQHTWVNGQSDSFIAFNFQVYPQKTGTFTIGPFNYSVDGQSQTLHGELNVVNTAGDAQQPQSWSDVLFARLEADRDSAYVQEPFGLMLSIYSRQGVQMAGNIALQGMPETGLDPLQWQEGNPDREVIHNAVYDVRRFRARTRAMGAGTFEFKPTVIAQVVAQDQNPRPRGFFDDPFGMFGRAQTRPVEMTVQGISFTVKPLPEAGQPAGFSGAVGQFDFQVTAQPTTVHPGDPITLTMIVSGDGNFDRVAPPPIPAGDWFRLFGETVRKQENNTVLFQQVISPRSADITEIPPIPFSFFDTRNGQYQTAQSQPIPITVTATSNSEAQVFATKNSVVLPPQETPFATESELQYLRSALQTFWKKIGPKLWMIPAIAGLWLLLSFGKKLYRRRKKDTARIRRQHAPKAAHNALKAASYARRQNNVTAFYDALWNALTNYFGNRLNLPPGDVTPSAALHTLEQQGFDPGELNTLRQLFQQIEACRYGVAGSTSSDEMNQLQNQLEQILKRCEKTKL